MNGKPERGERIDFEFEYWDDIPGKIHRTEDGLYILTYPGYKFLLTENDISRLNNLIHSGDS